MFDPTHLDIITWSFEWARQIKIFKTDLDSFQTLDICVLISIR